MDNENTLLNQMAGAAAKRVYSQAQRLRSKSTVTPSTARDILETGIQQLNANPGSNVGANRDRVLSLNQAPNERSNENTLFNKISVNGGEVSLPSPIVIRRDKYLRPARVHGKDGWFSKDQQLNEPGYLQDFGEGLHTVNYVMARLGGFSSLQQGMKKGSAMVTYFEGRDILLSSIFRALESIMKSNKKILDDFFDNNTPAEEEEDGA